MYRIITYCCDLLQPVNNSKTLLVLYCLLRTLCTLCTLCTASSCCSSLCSFFSWKHISPTTNGGMPVAVAPGRRGKTNANGHPRNQQQFCFSKISRFYTSVLVWYWYTWYIVCIQFLSQYFHPHKLIEKVKKIKMTETSPSWTLCSSHSRRFRRWPVFSNLITTFQLMAMMFQSENWSIIKHVLLYI